MRVIVCGSRRWSHAGILSRRLAVLPREGLVIVEGGALGADHIAAEWARSHDVKREVYPADWRKHGRSAGPIRNRQMLDAGADLVIAFRADGESRGTDDMIREAQRRGIPVEVIRP